jgi:hypothetical protein
LRRLDRDGHTRWNALPGTAIILGGDHARGESNTDRRRRRASGRI